MVSIEQRLRDAAEQGIVASFRAGEVIEAYVIRNILLSLPRGTATGVSPAGLLIEGELGDASKEGTRINGRIELSDVGIPGGGAIAPIALTNCILAGGFNGARSRFSSLRFKNCRFEDTRAENHPTIDLGGARLETGLYMAGITPHGIGDYLWIRAAGIRIAGAFDLSRSRLRAPPDLKDERLYCEPFIACIDLTKATIGGDLYALNGVRCEGCFNARGVHIQGNVWLGGATVEAPGSNALMLQRAIIDGSLVLDAPAERADGSGAKPAFICGGNLNLRAARIGGDADLRGAFVAGTAQFLDVEVRGDLIVDAAIRDNVRLESCRIDGSVYLSNLLVGVSFEELRLRAGSIGRALERLPESPDPKLIAARHGVLKCIPGAILVETLWKDRGDSDLFQIAFVRVKDRFHLLDGFAGGLQRAFGNGYALTTKEQAVEFLRLYGVYAHGEPGFPIVTDKAAARALTTTKGSSEDAAVTALPDSFFSIGPSIGDTGVVVAAAVVHGDRLVRCEFALSPGSGRIDVTKKHLVDGPFIEHVPAIRGAFLRHPVEEEADLRGAIMREEWPIGPAVAGMAPVRRNELSALQAALLRNVLAAFDLRGEVDLRHLTCDMLTDRGGDGWGPKAHFKLNHFVYRHADWRRDYPRTLGRSDERSLMPKWRRWISRRHSISGTARYDESRDNWEGRRSWLFQQYYFVTDQEPEPNRKPPEYQPAPFYSFRKIKDRHYRPQPLEQLARVARAEGRESAVAHSEILKQAIEWRHFNRAARWRLGYAAIIVAAVWLMFNGPMRFSVEGTLLASVCTLFVMARGTALRAAIVRVLDGKRDKPRHRSRTMRIAKLTVWALYVTPALLLFVSLGWFNTPFHFLMALSIFLVVRLLTTLAHGLFRGCFGYLRRPVRAIVTLIGAFIVGWVGVAVANRAEMLVVNAEPVATVASDAVPPARDDQTKTNRFVMGNPRVGHDTASFSHEISCRPVISEPLYALDVLIPIVDLGEERRCEIRRRPKEAEGTIRRAPGDMSVVDLLQNIPQLTVGNRRVWWWMKALYAIAGWLIVSLSILTFAHAMRAHAEPPTEHK